MITNLRAWLALGLSILALAAGACNGDSPTSPSATPPQVTSVSPSSGATGTTFPITISGTNFVVGGTPTATLSGSGITVTNVVVQSTTTATATVTIAPDAALGT